MRKRKETHRTVWGLKNCFRDCMCVELHHLSCDIDIFVKEYFCNPTLYVGLNEYFSYWISEKFKFWIIPFIINEYIHHTYMSWVGGGSWTVIWIDFSKIRNWLSMMMKMVNFTMWSLRDNFARTWCSIPHFVSQSCFQMLLSFDPMYWIANIGCSVLCSLLSFIKIMIWTKNYPPLLCPHPLKKRSPHPAQRIKCVI